MSIRRDRHSKRQPTWILDYVDENRIRHRTRVYCKRAVAEAKFGMILNEIEKRKMGLSNGAQYILLKDLTKQYILASETDGKSHLTIKRIQNAADAFMRWIGEDRAITEVSPHMIEEYKRNRLTEYTPRKTKLTKAGLNSELKHVKAMFNWSLKMGMISRSPFIGVEFVKTGEKPVRFLTTGEIKSLYEKIALAQDDDARALITVYLQTGARRSELLPPKFGWGNVDFIRRSIILVGKRMKRRTLPINDLLVEIMKNREGFEHPFDFSPDQVSRIVRKYYKLAGIENAGVHTLRKTCGSLLIQYGVDIYRVSKWLGHSTVTVTERHYTDLLRSEYDDISLLMAKNGAELAANNQPDGKLVPYLCHNSVQNGVFQST